MPCRTDPRHGTDYTLRIHGALRGGMLYLKDNMSVYRFGAPGSWSAGQAHSAQKRQGFFKPRYRHAPPAGRGHPGALALGFDTAGALGRAMDRIDRLVRVETGDV